MTKEPFIKGTKRRVMKGKLFCKVQQLYTGPAKWIFGLKEAAQKAMTTAESMPPREH